MTDHWLKTHLVLNYSAIAQTGESDHCFLCFPVVMNYNQETMPAALLMLEGICCIDCIGTHIK